MKLIIIFTSIVILTFISVFLCFPKQHTRFPENLIGTWTTSEQKYANRFFELSQISVTYGIGKKKTAVYYISNAEKHVQDNTMLYTIEYHNSDGIQYTRSFYYDATNGGVIKFKNQKHIPWTKNKDTRMG
jgi:hypothetical protein